MNQPLLSLDAARTAMQRLPNPALAGFRAAALESFARVGMPTVGDEDWRYTRLDSATNVGNQWLQSGRAAEFLADEKTVDEITGAIDAYWFIVSNGIADANALASDSIEFSPLSEQSAPDMPQSALGHLNAALLIDGSRVRVCGPLDKPLGILCIDHADEHAGFSQCRIDLQIDEGVQANIVEVHRSTGKAAHYANGVVNLRLDRRASATLTRLQHRDTGHLQTALFSATLKDGAALKMTSIDLGGELCRNEVNITLAGRGAEADLHGLYLAGSGQHIDNHVRIDHEVGPSRSVQSYQGVLGGRCRGVWNGKAVVHAVADGSDATQSNHNLLLSERAEVDTKPELEIHTDDVKCSHGATIGQLDGNALYYLRSRGIDPATARHMLTEAFALGVVSSIDDEAARAFVSELVTSRMSELIQEAG